MKLLRCGNKNNEKPAALDKNGKIRDLYIKNNKIIDKPERGEKISKVINLKNL